MLKQCRECKNRLPHELFGKKGETKVGNIKRDTICKNCRSSVYQRFLELYGVSGLKECTTCHKSLPWDCFSHRITENKRYLRSSCKDCSQVKWKKWADLHPEHKDNKVVSDKKAHLAYKKYDRHGITRDQYLIMLEVQQGGCAICKLVEKDNSDLSIDHNHDTGDVRGLLCKQCNRALGLFGDNIMRLESALEYLRSRGSYG